MLILFFPLFVPGEERVCTGTGEGCDVLCIFALPLILLENLKNYGKEELFCNPHLSGVLSYSYLVIHRG